MILMLILLPGSMKHLQAQDYKSISAAEDTLRIIQHSIMLEKSDCEKELKNSRFESLLLKILKLPGAGLYPFDSIKWMGRLISPDKRFRIFNWNIPFSDGSQKYFSIIQLNQMGDKEILVRKLTDRSDSIDEPEKKVLDQDQWYGALYYKIIPFETDRKRNRYLLLGWHGKDTQITQKIIEILTIDSTSNISFGAPLFKQYADGQNTRIIFRFSATASMVLRYEDQRLSSTGKWNPKSRLFDSETKKVMMVVCDHLIPIDPNLSGQFQFYIPSSDQSDGFKYDKGYWVFVSDIDARNKP